MISLHGGITAAKPAAPPAPANAAAPGPATPAAPFDPAQQMNAVVVSTAPYRDIFPPLPRYGVRLDVPGFWPVGEGGANSFILLGPMVVTATRTPQPPENVAHTARVFTDAALRSQPTTTLDGTLRAVPGFSLFRRSDSLTANPTAQGLSLRGLGPSGASRSLVLLDGVPLNDPFGGWVAWTKIPREGLARAELIPGGGATAWGNASLGGVLQLFTRAIKGESILVRLPPPPGSGPYAEGPLAWGTRATLQFNATLGDFGTRSAEISGVYPLPGGLFQLLARDFTTDGFSLVAPERRGLIDVPAWSRHRFVAGRWRQPLGKTAELLATVREFEEFRGNGTPYTRNGSREKFASLQAAGSPDENFAWQLTGYAQDQSFASTFSSVNATRTAETPASDQFAVPAIAAGAAWTGSWSHARGARTSAGGDLRFVRGETRENFTFVNGNFTRQRIAGGEQSFAGVFALHEQPLADGWSVTTGARLDAWHDTDGHRRETDRATGVSLRDDHYPDQSGLEFSPSAGVIWAPAKTWRLRANAQHAFRRPTLNELYRPFRQGANITEANPALRTERVMSGEIGGEWSVLRAAAPRPTPRGRPAFPQEIVKPTVIATFGLTAFYNDLRDAVGNVTVARGPGTFPLFGTIAAGGVGRQRLNLDRIRVQGLELSARWTPRPAFSFSADYLYDDATVGRAPVAPALVGKRVAQVPRQSGTVGATWRGPGQFTLTPRIRWIGRQFEDDENQLVLGEVVVADVGLSRPLGKHLEVFLNLENVTNARIETGRSVDGVVNVGTPRFMLGGVRGSW